MNYQHVIECKGSLPFTAMFTARHWLLSWATWIHSIFSSLSMQTIHSISLPSHSSVDKGNLQIHLRTAHYFIWWRHTKWNTHSKTTKQDHFWWCSNRQQCDDTRRRALLTESHWGMNVWHILCKMKEDFLGKKSASNQRSLAQSATELAWVTMHFLQAAKKIVCVCGGGVRALTALNLSTIKSYYCCVILLYQTSEFQSIILTLCNFIK
jgi:hypothetical protein